MECSNKTVFVLSLFVLFMFLFDADGAAVNATGETDDTSDADNDADDGAGDADNNTDNGAGDDAGDADNADNATPANNATHANNATSANNANNAIYVDNVHNATLNGTICRPTIISSYIWEPSFMCWGTCVGICLSLYSADDGLCVKTTRFAGSFAKCMCCNGWVIPKLW